MVLPELGLLPFLNATLLEGHQYGVGKLWCAAFQRRIDNLLEVLRSKTAQENQTFRLPYGNQSGLRVLIETRRY